MDGNDGKFGIRQEQVINGVGTVTVLGGSIMPSEVVEAMGEASKHFIQLPELQRKVGGTHRRAAQGPCRHGFLRRGVSHHGRHRRLCGRRRSDQGGPSSRHFGGLKNEIVQQKSHRSGYEAQIDLVGTKTVWVETCEN